MNPAPAPAPDDARFMRLALEQAQRAAEQGEVPIGAVVVCDGQVIARAHNAPIGLQDPTAHAEVRALRDAAQVMGNYRLGGCTLYVTLEPCAMCCGAILQARLARVVFGAHEPRTGAAGSVLDVLGSPLNHQTKVCAGVLAADSAALLQQFFSARRLRQQRDRAPLREDALRTPEDRWAGLELPWQRSRFHSDWPSLQGWRLHCFDNRDDATQPTTLYLHGPHAWSAAYAEALARPEPAVALDWLGFGLSDKPKKPSVHTPALHAAVLADALARWPVTQIVAPRAVAPVLACWRAAGATPPVLWADEPSLSPTLAQAPYPDRGHEAGRRAWRAFAAPSDDKPSR